MGELPTPPRGYRTQSPDTDYWAEKLQFDHWRRMQPWQKAELCTALTRAVHELSLAGLRVRFPEASERDLELRAAALRLGEDVVARIARDGGA
jgi:hypothetical protein